MRNKGYSAVKPLLVFALLCVLCASCNKYETYAEQKENEVDAIKAYIAKKGIKVISESEFFAKDSMTDASKNEYVLFNSSGVYMQIVHKGCGSKIKNGESVKVLCRFSEYSVVADTLRLTTYPRYTENMIVNNSNSTFSASFISTQTEISMMTSAYGSTSVPSGWLVPFPYVKVGRPAKETDHVAEVNIIVPHTQGHTYATQNVTPYFYNISFQRGL